MTVSAANLKRLIGLADEWRVEPAAAKLKLRRARRLGFAWLALLSVLLTAYAAVTLVPLGSGAVQDAFGRWVYDAVLIGAALAVLARAISVSAERKAWLVLGIGLLLWAFGQVYYSILLYYANPAPFPSPSDALFLAFYPAAYLALVLLMRARVARLERLAWVDGLIGALAVAAVAAALIFPPVLEALGASPLGVAVSLAYPCADLVLLGMVVGALSASEWRTQRGWALIAIALLLFAVSDVVYLSVAGQATQALDVASIGWPLAFLLLAAAAWLPGHAVTAIPRGAGRRRIALPIGLAAAVAVLLALGSFEPIGAAAVGLGVACLFALLVRLGITFDENRRMLAASRQDALTDPLTGLGNRRRLMIDLEGALAPGRSEAAVLAIFDLDGFKAYNDRFGHPAGDDVLRRLSGNLTSAVGSSGHAYRLGGDEFCVLASIESSGAAEICLAAEAALSERGRGFSIAASWGMVRLPAEARTVTDAMRLADRRMYARKGQQADSPRSQAQGVLLGVLHEREPELDRHLRGVMELATEMGRALELDAEELDVLARAAELHDIGLVAIPREILHKRSPLSEGERALLRRHPLVGERVLSAAPAMSEVAKLVRSTHERWDGGGYPDGLTGTDIPLGSRIILICDAYTAMTEGRPYREPLRAQAALEMLREGAGKQFDPELVELFARLVEPVIVAVEASALEQG